MDEAEQSADADHRLEHLPVLVQEVETTRLAADHNRLRHRHVLVAAD